MTKERMGEIALSALKAKVRREGLELGPNFRRKIGNSAKDMGITLVEALEFAEILARDLWADTFDSKAPAKPDSAS